MGCTLTLTNLFHAFFFFFLLICNFSYANALIPSSSTHDQTKPKPRPKSSPPQELSQYQVYYIKNTTPFFLDKEAGKNNGKKGKAAKKRKKTSKNSKSRPFSVMLPKGLVPPSGSSPCHNAKPNSKVVFYCELSTVKP
ncbi:hypothetical protein Tsubulata_020890 [Turnera subulata]|uniref:BURP domain-containing protein n=1 Tax=Turnera subulata TaxID=218843 RepID=A0A9Q0J6Q1_9ROSI|nr:hypothetical protein Tsubulata_020890 [Turnera subulata]